MTPKFIIFLPCILWGGRRASAAAPDALLALVLCWLWEEGTKEAEGNCAEGEGHPKPHPGILEKSQGGGQTRTRLLAAACSAQAEPNTHTHTLPTQSLHLLGRAEEPGLKYFLSETVRKRFNTAAES